jgi:ribosome-associated heat shock protein Hsp15
MPDAGIRLDKYLWCARLVKSRQLAREFIEQGSVRLNRVKVLKPSHGIREGDILTFFWSGRPHVWRVSAIPLRRGPPAEARLLYQELAEPDPQLRGNMPRS